MEDDIIKKTIAQIEEQKISPQPKWHFLLKDYTFWVFLGASIILGAVSVSIILFLLTSYDWDIYQYLHTSLLGYVLMSVPYLWVAILVIFTLVAYYNFKHTKTGYRHSAHAMVLISIFLSFIIGTTFFFVGFCSDIHGTFSRHIPFYNNLIFDKNDVWDNASNGLLGGVIVDIRADGSFLLKDFKGNIWQIAYGRSDDLGRWPIALGMNVKLLGRRGEANIFYVEDMRPWGGINLRKKIFINT